ncbi:MAG: HAMP domain-containing histidine kinase [Alphaproteobacteria bacterium]|nr:HAMP domain-containing histidine kinase [Alphaproteobacteria bacterium]
MWWMYWRDVYELAAKQRKASQRVAFGRIDASSLTRVATGIAQPTIAKTDAKAAPAKAPAPVVDEPYTPEEMDDVNWYITQMDRMEESLRKAEQQLEEANRGRQAFLSSMSHELRTPLNAIMGFSEMMRNQIFGDVGHPNYREYVTNIHDSGQQLLSKVNDLLEIASLDSGGMAMKEEPFSLNELLSEVREIFSHEAFTRDISLKLDIPHSITLHADRRQLLCALSNFLSNAVKHSLNGGEIHLSARPQGQDGLVIAVRDFGKGMPDEQLKTIRAALQSDAAYFKVEGNGIGLGLSLAKELIARHHGKVSIESMRGQGTVVSMYLPAERVITGLSAKKTHLRMV